MRLHPGTECLTFLGVDFSVSPTQVQILRKISVCHHIFYNEAFMQHVFMLTSRPAKPCWRTSPDDGKQERISYTLPTLKQFLGLPSCFGIYDLGIYPCCHYCKPQFMQSVEKLRHI